MSTPRPHGRTIILGRHLPVAAQRSSLRGYGIQLSVGDLDAHIDVDTAIRVRDELTRTLAEVLPPARGYARTTSPDDTTGGAR